MCSSSPDTSGINRAAEASAALGKEALDWFKSTYAAEAPARQAAAARAQAVSDAQLKGMNFATDRAMKDAAYTDTVFRPLERRIVTDAQNYDTPWRRAMASERATAGVERAFGNAQTDLQNRLMRTEGGAMGSGRSLALMQDAALAKAKARAGASSNAVDNVEQQGYARRMDAAGMGRGVVGSQATQQQIATSTGNASAGNAMQALGATQSGTPLMTQGFNTAMAGQANAGNLYGNIAGLEAQTRGQDLGLLSTAFGGFMRSSKKVKKRHGEVDDAKVLREITDEGAPVERWQYDPAKGGPDDGGRMHIGPMAEDVRETMGEAAAPGGEVIDMREVGGKLIAGMRALNERLERVEKEIA